jgi:uncharacterized protein YqhQ
MIYIALLLLSVLFIELFILFDINDTVRSVLRISRDAYSVMRSPELDENQKERFIRRSALDMFRITLVFIVKITFILLVLYVLYIILSSVFSLSEDRLIAASFLPQTIIALILLGFLYIRLRSVIIRRLQSH